MKNRGTSTIFQNLLLGNLPTTAIPQTPPASNLWFPPEVSCVPLKTIATQVAQQIFAFQWLFQKFRIRLFLSHLAPVATRHRRPR